MKEGEMRDWSKQEDKSCFCWKVQLVSDWALEKGSLYDLYSSSTKKIHSGNNVEVSSFISRLRCLCEIYKKSKRRHAHTYCTIQMDFIQSAHNKIRMLFWKMYSILQKYVFFFLGFFCVLYDKSDSRSHNMHQIPSSATDDERTKTHSFWGKGETQIKYCFLDQAATKQLIASRNNSANWIVL